MPSQKANADARADAVAAADSYRDTPVREPQTLPMLPTWRPDEPHPDAAKARIHPAETNGEYSAAPDGSHPRHDNRTAGSMPSDDLLGPTER